MDTDDKIPLIGAPSKRCLAIGPKRRLLLLKLLAVCFLLYLIRVVLVARDEIDSSSSPPRLPFPSGYHMSSIKPERWHFVPEMDDDLESVDDAVAYAKHVCRPFSRHSRFANVRKLGQSVATVNLVQSAGGQFYAMKHITYAAIAKNGWGRHLLQEIRAMALFDHPNVVRFYGCFHDQYSLYYIYEYIHGLDLDGLLRLADDRFRQGSGRQPLAFEQIAEVARQMFAGLQYIHSLGFLHRDIKPENVMVATDGTVKIIDFSFTDRADSCSKRALGTAEFMPPEILSKGSVHFSPASDIWSAAATLFYMAASDTPIERRHYANAVKNLGEYIDLMHSLYSEWTYPNDLICEEANELFSNTLGTDPGKRWQIEKILESRLLSTARGKTDLARIYHQQHHT